MTKDPLTILTTSHTPESTLKQTKVIPEEKSLETKEQVEKTSELAAACEAFITSVQSIVPTLIDVGAPIVNKLITVGGAPVSLIACFGLVLLTLKPFIEVMGVTASPVIGLLAVSLVLASLSVVLEVIYDILRLLK